MHGIVIPGLYWLAGLMAFTVVYHFATGIYPPRDRVQILFASVCLLMVPFAISMALVLQAADAAVYIRALKGNLAAAILLFAIFPWFIGLYTGLRPLPLLIAIGLLSAVLFVVNLTHPYSLQFEQFYGIHTLPLPWGETLVRGSGKNGPWFDMAIAMVTVVFIHALIAMGRKYRRQHLNTDLAILVAIVLFLLSAIQGIMVRLGILHGIILGPFGFIALVLCMSASLGYGTQQKLRTSERHFRSLFENSPTGMLAISPDIGRIIQANPVALNLTGYDIEEILRRTVADLTFPEDMEESRHRYMQLATGQVKDMHDERRYRTRNGGSFIADHYVSTLKDEHGKVVRFIANITDITERKRTEESLRQNEEKYRTIFENSPLGIFRSTANGRFLEVNPAMARMNGFDSPETMIREVTDIAAQLYSLPEDRKAIISRLLDGSTDIVQYQHTQLRRDGSEYLAYITLKVVRDAQRNPLFFDGIIEDVTARERAEKEGEELRAQLIQAQKMDSIGRLAGGIAHDFNNMLGVIIAYSDLALGSGIEDAKLVKRLREIRNAANRSADLTRQLLTFARKQNVLPKAIDPNQAVESMLKILQRMISEDVVLEWRPDADAWPVMADPSQLDQILANLCVNARDAIDGVGRIRIETANETIHSEFCARHPGAKPGDYVRLSVSDNGSGMDADTLSKVFEPFFTTKELGRGTGLGLSTVYGIVQQSKGFIDVKSEPGRGSVFSVYLPRQEGTAILAADVVQNYRFDRGHEHILLVEDEPAILDVARSILETCGYTVLPAQSPAEATRIAQAHIGEIHMLITDIIMPGMNGRELAENLLLLRPGMKCLYMSGYSGDVIAHQGVIEQGLHFIQKPFTMAGLTTKVRSVLDEA
jgi:PAS domain S-box-containing protein